MKTENIYKKLRESTETDLQAALTQSELATIFKEEGNPLSQSVISKLETSQKIPPTSSVNVIKTYALHFNVTADYLLGIRQNAVADENDAMIGRVTGLTDKSIEVLKCWNKNSKIELLHFNELETLNLLLENIYERQSKINNGIGFADSLFHYIGLYLHSTSYIKAKIDKIRYRHDNKYWKTLQIGDSVNNHTVQAISMLYEKNNGNANDPDSITLYDKDSADKQPYKISVFNLFETYTIDQIQEKLRKLKEWFENREKT